MTAHAKNLPELDVVEREALLSRMFRNIARVDSNGCWLWKLKSVIDGYGRVGITTQRYRGHHSAHRVMYELLIGPIPADHVPDHRCHVRACINPFHTEAVPVRVNSQRSRRARANHCPKGHVFDEANTRWYTHPKSGQIRYCRACCRAQRVADKAAHPERWRLYGARYREKQKQRRPV